MLILVWFFAASDYLSVNGWYMAQNYAAGNPACVLYIKNLAKDVVTDDFYFVFGKYEPYTRTTLNLS